MIDISSAFPSNLRAPLDLLVVLDVSKSMGMLNTNVIEATLDRKLTSADYVDNSQHTTSVSDGVRCSGILKSGIWEILRQRKAPSPLRVCQNTLIDLLSRLRPDLGDRLGIVTFADTARVLMPLGVVNVIQMTKGIEDITTEGGTNIENALQVAFQHLSDIDIEPHRLLEIWFLTDGKPSAGEASPVALRNILEQLMEDQAERIQSRPTLSAIGYGNDCESDMLRMLGEEGGGQMHMIACNSSDSDKAVQAVLDQLLNNAFRTICKNVDVICTLTGGVFLGEPITSFRYEQDDDVTLTIFISDLRRDEPKTFVVRYQPKQYPCFVTAEITYFNVIAQEREVKKIEDMRDALLLAS
jgi:hypothetical protein